MKWPEWLGATESAIFILTALIGLLVYLNSKGRLYLGRKKREREEAREVDEDYKRSSGIAIFKLGLCDQ